MFLFTYKTLTVIVDIIRNNFVFISFSFFLELLPVLLSLEFIMENTSLIIVYNLFNFRYGA